MLFLGAAQMKATCVFPRYTPPLSTSGFSCFAQRGRSQPHVSMGETPVIFHPPLPSATRDGDVPPAAPRVLAGAAGKKGEPVTYR